MVTYFFRGMNDSADELGRRDALLNHLQSLEVSLLLLLLSIHIFLGWRRNVSSKFSAQETLQCFLVTLTASSLDLVLLLLPDSFKGMGAWRKTIEPQKQGKSPRPTSIRLNVVVQSPTSFGLGLNSCWPFQGFQLPLALPSLSSLRFKGHSLLQTF